MEHTMVVVEKEISRLKGVAVLKATIIDKRGEDGVCSIKCFHVLEWHDLKNATEESMQEYE